MSKRDEASWTADVIRHRPGPFDPRSVAHEFAQLARSYGCTRITGDSFASIRSFGARTFTACTHKPTANAEDVPPNVRYWG
jgi:hypothetical protein